MVALNYELLQVAETRFNPLKERELVLRDYNIPQIENLAVLNDQYDALDLTNNRLTALANFPRMTSLATLLASGNQIAALAPDLAEQLPNLHTLNLAANRMTHLGDLDVLGQLDKLEVLLLAGNAVTRHPHYRSYVIHRCPRVRILDWEKVRDAERNAASTLFSGDEGLALAYRLSGKKPSVLRSATGKASIPGDAGAQAGVADTDAGAGAGAQPTAARRGGSEERIQALKAAIQAATSIEDVVRLEKELSEAMHM